MNPLFALSLAGFQPANPVICDADSAERMTIEAVLAQSTSYDRPKPVARFAGADSSASKKA